MGTKRSERRNICIGREVSWLSFNERVLLQADAEEVPLLERMRFLAIFTSNLDEFFMVRAGCLHDRALLGDVPTDNKTGMTAAEQLKSLYSEARRLYTLRDKIAARLDRTLADAGIVHCEFPSLSKEEKKTVRRFFKKELAPIVTPYIIDQKHPFPHLEGKVPHILLSLRAQDERSVCGIVPVPKEAQPLLALSSENGLRYITTIEILHHFADELFKRFDVKSKVTVKITRNADMEIADNFSDDPGHEHDYMEYLKILLKKREKLCAVRLEYLSYPKSHSERVGDPSRAVEFLCRRLGLAEEGVYRSYSPISYSFASHLIKAASQQLPDGVYTPIPPKPAATGDLFELLKERDILLAYPYHSIRTYLDFLRRAVFDEAVESIRITLYRLSEHSEIVSLLRTAAEMGKAVTAVVELKARFDEENNINWAQLLEESGCHVIYGMSGLKVHSKVTLVDRKNGVGYERFAHIATGNYNEQTAKQYTDLGILTSNRQITEDASELFRSLAAGTLSSNYKCLLVSPTTLKPRILAEISRERDRALCGHSAYICMKMNSMTDKDIIDALSEASSAGVEIDLIIRGICCLRAGVEGKTDNIRVISIVGRYLEHSRVFIFGTADGRIGTEPPRVYIGSADMMTRNTCRRIEVITPILDTVVAERLVNICRTELSDNVKASQMLPDGTYKKIEPTEKKVDSQIVMYEELGDESALR